MGLYGSQQLLRQQEQLDFRVFFPFLCFFFRLRQSSNSRRSVICFLSGAFSPTVSKLSLSWQQLKQSISRSVRESARFLNCKNVRYQSSTSSSFQGGGALQAVAYRLLSCPTSLLLCSCCFLIKKAISEDISLKNASDLPCSELYCSWRARKSLMNAARSMRIFISSPVTSTAFTKFFSLSITPIYRAAPFSIETSVVSGVLTSYTSARQRYNSSKGIFAASHCPLAISFKLGGVSDMKFLSACFSFSDTSFRQKLLTSSFQNFSIRKCFCVSDSKMPKRGSVLGESQTASLNLTLFRTTGLGFFLMMRPVLGSQSLEEEKDSGDLFDSPRSIQFDINYQNPSRYQSINSLPRELKMGTERAFGNVIRHSIRLPSKSLNPLSHRGVSHMIQNCFGNRSRIGVFSCACCRTGSLNRNDGD